MSANTKQIGAASQYAQAMLELANQHNSAVETGRELAQLREVAQQNPVFLEYLRDPGISSAERQQVLERTFKGGLAPLTYSFLGVLNSKGRLGLLPHIADAYEDLLSEQLGQLEVAVTVAQAMDASTMEEVRQRISAAFKKEAIIHQRVDESIIGGLVLQVGDTVIDASVKSQLEAMKKRLLSAAR
jgi:ATP synthase F1 delta subunit